MPSLFLTAIMGVRFLAVELPAVEESRYDADRVRIQRHLDNVLKELAAPPFRALTDDQRLRREALLEELRRYRDKGRFPHNEVVPGRSPIFIDAEGRPCAVGHLMISSGAAELAELISRSENLARVHEIETPGVLEWANASGFSLNELARIQPAYSGPSFCQADCVNSPCFLLPPLVCPLDGPGSTDAVCDTAGVRYRNNCVAKTCLKFETSLAYCSDPPAPASEKACSCASTPDASIPGLELVLVTGLALWRRPRIRRLRQAVGSDDHVHPSS